MCRAPFPGELLDAPEPPNPSYVSMPRGNLLPAMVSKALRTRATPHIPASAAPVSREQLEAGAANFIIGLQRSLLWRCVMPLEPQAAPTAGKAVRQTPGQNLGSLNGCLVEGDPEQRARERSVRRRALIMSIAVQGAALAVLILVPRSADRNESRSRVSCLCRRIRKLPHRESHTQRRRLVLGSFVTIRFISRGLFQRTSQLAIPRLRRTSKIGNLLGLD